MSRDFEYRFCDPLIPPAKHGGQPPKYERKVDNGVLIEKDVAVAMRDGVKIYADVYRPADEKPAPPLIAWGPYGKHGTWHKMNEYYDMALPGCDLPYDRLSQYTVFEAPDPMWWVPQGYAIITMNPRGTWYSEGNATFVSPEERCDEYDLIEWAGTQPWSNGKVGLLGVSYLAFSQYGAASLNPPHLAAINPWEGWNDFYREVATHGGIPETGFWGRLPFRWGVSSTKLEDVRQETVEHPFFDAFWQSKMADLSKITVPAYIVASWTDQGLHTRGTLEVFQKISSQQKWLHVHGQKKWPAFYEPEALERQRVFFDHFLKGKQTEIAQWPKVKLEVRERYGKNSYRNEQAWPLPRTEYRKLYLNAQNGTLNRQAVPAEASVSYEAKVPPGEDSPHAQFDFKFDQTTDLIGHMKLKLWIAPQGADDMDIFVAALKLDKDGHRLGFAYFMQFDSGPVALGWLRASHYELDPAKSTEYQPVLKHERERKLKDGEIVPLEIEIWPSGTRFEAGETLRLVVQGSDICWRKEAFAQDFHGDTVNNGNHAIHTGGKYDSHLLVPVAPR